MPLVTLWINIFFTPLEGNSSGRLRSAINGMEALGINGMYNLADLASRRTKFR
jgi:hypothetical protein